MELKMDSCQIYNASLQFAMIKKLLLCIALQNVTILQIDKMRYFEVYIKLLPFNCLDK